MHSRSLLHGVGGGSQTEDRQIVPLAQSTLETHSTQILCTGSQRNPGHWRDDEHGVGAKHSPLMQTVPDAQSRACTQLGMEASSITGGLSQPSADTTRPTERAQTRAGFMIASTG